MKVCLRCRTDNPDNAKTCRLCASPMPKSETTCARGHIMDPAWMECAYCKAGSATGASSASAPGSGSGPPMPPRSAAAARGKTVVEGRTILESEVASSAGPVRRLTDVEDSASSNRSAPRPFTGGSSAIPSDVPGRGKTVYGTPALGVPSVAKARKIVGVLVSYSWHREGRVYEVREGRNLIGRDATCEICVPEDQTLSGVNSHITFRQTFVVGDMVSMMGTDVNGVPVIQQFETLNNYAGIRAGSTYFTFIAIALEASGTTET